MSTSNQLHFLLTADLNGYVFNPLRSEGLKFCDPTNELQIEIRSKRERGGSRDGFDDLEFRAKTSRKVAAEHVEFVEALIEGVYLKEYGTVEVLPYVIGGEQKIDAEGRVSQGHLPTWDMVPTALQEMGHEIDRDLKAKFTRFLKLLRWQQKVSGPVDIVREEMNESIILNPGDASPGSLYWKTSHANYFLVPPPRQEPTIISVDSWGGLRWTEDVLQEFTDLWMDETAQEPLGHQLLREAKNIANVNYRSSLMIAYAALEVGLKQHISAFQPKVAWLVMNTQSPPISRILREYLPQLHKGNPLTKHWSGIKKDLNETTKFAEDRNRLAHRGEETKGSLDRYLSLTEDLLYIFDALEGRQWAKLRVSSQRRNKLGWD